MPIHAHDRLYGGAVAQLRSKDPSVGHEQDRVAVVLQARMSAGKVGLGQFDQLILVLANDRFAARTRYMCLHVAALPFYSATTLPLGCRLHLLLM